MSGFEPYNSSAGTAAADEFREREKLERTGAPPVSDRILQCIAFLSTVARIQVADTAKDAKGDTSYVINVFLTDASDKKTDDNATSTSFQIQRTFKEFKELHHVVEHWSKKHGRKGCTYCPIYQSTDLPGALSRMTMSKDKMEKHLFEFLDAYIVNARRPRPTERECQGFDHIPSIVTRFLTKDLPAADADTQASESAAPADAEAKP